MLTIAEVATLSKFSLNEARWRIDQLVRRSIVKCSYIRGIQGERLCGKRAVEVLMHLWRLENDYGASPLMAINLVDKNWRKKVLKSPRLKL